MKEQHKEMLRLLKSGEFDERAFARTAALRDETSEENEAAAALPPVPIASSSSASNDIPKHQQSLDEIILDYLVAGDD
jgi:hypothetical protein